MIVCVGARLLGAKPPEGGYVIAARILTAYYFAHFLIVLPLLGLFETPMPCRTRSRTAVLASTARRTPWRAGAAAAPNTKG